MVDTLNHINELIEKNKGDFKNSNYLAVSNEISTIENEEIREKLDRKLNSIYSNRINGKGIIRGNELEQVIKEFNEMQDMINNYVENLSIENVQNEERVPLDIPEINDENELELEISNEEPEIEIKDDFSSLEDYLNRDKIKREEQNLKRRELSKEERIKLGERYAAKNIRLGDNLDICKEFLKSQKNNDGKQYYTDEYLETMTDDEIVKLANDIFENTSYQINYYNRNLLYGIVNDKGIRKYTDEEIQSMDNERVNEIISTEIDGLSEDEIIRIQNRARREEIIREKAKNTPVAPTNFEELIEKYKEQLTKETPLEEAKNIIDRISDAIIEIYKKEQIEFEENLKNATTLEAKLEIIEKREEKLNEYKNYYNFEQELNSETLAYIEEKKNELNNKITLDYNEKKQNGEYCWKEFSKVNESKKYIDENIKDELKTQFNDLTEKMYDIVNNPNQEQYDNWKNNMNEFVNNSKLDKDKLTPYLTAQLRIKHPDKTLTVDNNFDIDGLGLTKTETKPIKKRAKVKEVKKGIGAWFKKHKNKLILIGIGLALTTLLVYQIPTVQMMINSALWNIGKAKGTLSLTELNNLHSLNLGISKVAGGGKYAFDAASGLYTLGGQAGAQALYNAGQAGLVHSLMSIAGIGGLGLAASGVITHVIDKIKNWKKKKTGDDVELDEPEKTESEPEKIEDEPKVSKENKKELEDYSKEELIDIIKKQEERYAKLEERYDKLEEKLNKELQKEEEYKKMVDELKVGIKSTGTKEENKEIKEGSPENFAKLIEQYKNLSPEQQQIVAERFEQEQGKHL